MNMITCPNCGFVTANSQCPNCGRILYQPQPQYQQPQQYNNSQQIQPQFYQQPQQTYFQQPQPMYYQQFQSSVIMYYIAVVFGIISSIIAAISIVLPFYDVEVWGYKESVSLSQGSSGYILFVFALIGLLVSMPSKHKYQMGISHIIVSLIIGYIAIEKIMKVETDSTFEEYRGFVHKGSGCYLALAGAICLLITGLLFSVSHNLRKKK